MLERVDFCLVFVKGDIEDFYTYEKEIDTLNYGHVFFAFLLLSKKRLGMCLSVVKRN